MKNIQKYLANYAERFSFVVEDFKKDVAAVLPCFGEEAENVRKVLQSLREAAVEAKKEVLAILVVNQRVNATSAYKQKNQEVLRGFNCEEKLYSLKNEEALSLLVLNYTFPEKEFSEKEGVGLARKIGCDLATLLYANGSIKSPWIYTTDMDARVRSDYFQEENLSTKIALKIYPFQHSTETQEPKALLLYDIWMRYYTLSLRKAASPFAFSTLGSTFCINAHAYATVRGFPNRLAAEDFHLASKLSKVGAIQYSSLSPLYLIGRDSDRVPFGTGVGTNKYAKLLQEEEEIKFINPKCFDLLKNFIASYTAFFKSPGETLPSIPKEIDTELHLTELIQTALKSRTNAKDRVLHFFTAFDALKTLRFVHLAGDFYFEDIVYSRALAELNPQYDPVFYSLEQISERMAGDEKCKGVFSISEY